MTARGITAPALLALGLLAPACGGPAAGGTLVVFAAASLILFTFVLYPLAGMSLLPQKWSEFLTVALGVLSGRGLQILSERLPRQPGRFLVLALLLLSLIAFAFLRNQTNKSA